MGDVITYADTTRCPGCRSVLPPESASCPQCELPLHHPLTGRLLDRLVDADVLVAQLRDVVATSPAASPAPAPAPAAARSATPAAVPVGTVLPLPALPAPPRRTGVRTASVPAILLGLGATCLVVAAVAFLAVAWTWLDVGGRTLVLVSLTLGASAAGLLAERHRLRAAAESFTCVAAGLLVLDVLGAHDARWFATGTADPEIETLTWVVGAALLLLGATTSAVARRLVSAQVVAGLGLLLLSQGLLSRLDAAPACAATAVVGLALVVEASRRLARGWLAGAAAVVAVLCWLELAVVSLVALDDATLTWSHVWLHGPGWALVATTALTLAPAAIVRHRVVTLACATTAATLLSVVLALPALDESLDAVTLTAIGVALAWTTVVVLLPASLRLVAQVPAVLAASPVAVVVASLTARAGHRALHPRADLHLSHHVTTPSPALLLGGLTTVLAVLVVAALAPVRLDAVAGRGSARVRRVDRADAVTAAVVVALVLALGAVATLALLPVALWSIVLALVGLALLTAGAALAAPFGTDGPRGLLAVAGTGTATALLGAALLVGAPSPALLVVGTCALLVLAVGVLALGCFAGAAEVGGVLLPVALASVLGSLAGPLHVEVDHVAVPVMLVTGLVAVLRARAEVELAALTCWLVAVAAAIGATGDPAYALAVHLTVAGAVVVVTSLVNPSRRRLGAVGGALLALATWVRLGDLGVHSPEPYTLPAALVLVVVGVLYLRRHPEAATAPVLTTGLSLALTPSLLWVAVGDPVVPRAAWLGLACLVVMAGGALLRWNAPLLVGAAAGLLLALVEVAPYAATVPQWLSIGAAGTLLTVVGVTWERRLVDVRRASDALARLR